MLMNCTCGKMLDVQLFETKSGEDHLLYRDADVIQGPVITHCPRCNGALDDAPADVSVAAGEESIATSMTE